MELGSSVPGGGGRGTGLLIAAMAMVSFGVGKSSGIPGRGTAAHRERTYRRCSVLLKMVRIVYFYVTCILPQFLKRNEALTDAPCTEPPLKRHAAKAGPRGSHVMSLLACNARNTPIRRDQLDEWLPEEEGMGGDC